MCINAPVKITKARISFKDSTFKKQTLDLGLSVKDKVRNSEIIDERINTLLFFSWDLLVIKGRPGQKLDPSLYFWVL